MRRVVIRAPGILELERFELPDTPDAGHARLEPIAIGICGSDLHVMAGHHPFVSYPVHPGHEVLARVVSLAQDVDPGWLGARVVLEPSLACGHCPACLRGDYNICHNLKVMGFQAPGGMADAFDAPVDRLHRVPHGLSDDAAVLAEPMAVATHAVRLAGNAGQSVAVIGAGTIGILCAIALRSSGANVTVVDTDPQRRQLAAGFGLTSQESVSAGAYDTAFECVGVEAALRAAVAGVAKGGTVLVVGVHGSDPAVQAGLIQDHELRLQGSLMYTRQDYGSAFRLLEHTDLSAFITGRHALENAAEAFRQAAAGGRMLKVLLSA